MYHIPDDKRAKVSAWRIYQSVRHVLVNKKLCDVTITDVNKQSGISRTTFYRLFDNITDVLEMQLEQFFREYESNSKLQKDRLLYFFKYFDKHSDLIFILARQNESVIKTVMERTLLHSFSEISAVNEYEISLKIGMMTSILCKWVLRLKKESPSKMAEITKKLISKGEALFTDI